MKRIVSLDAPVGQPDMAGTLHDIIGNPYERNPYDTTGKCPLPLRSSWGMDDQPHAPEKRPEWLFFIDGEDGNTITQTKDYSLAQETAADLRRIGMRVVIRSHLIDEEQLQEDIRQARKMARWESGFGA